MQFAPVAGLAPLKIPSLGRSLHRSAGVGKGAPSSPTCARGDDGFPIFIFGVPPCGNRSFLENSLPTGKPCSADNSLLGWSRVQRPYPKDRRPPNAAVCATPSTLSHPTSRNLTLWSQKGTCEHMQSMCVHETTAPQV